MFFKSKLGTGTKHLTRDSRRYESVWKKTFGDDTTPMRYMVRIHYDEHHYKTIILKRDTKAKLVCAIGAKKLGLDRFNFGLVGTFGKSSALSVPVRRRESRPRKE